VDAAITEGTANLMSMFYTLSSVGGWSTKRAANMLDSGAHFYNTYETSDGKYVSIGAIEPQFYALLKDKLGLTVEFEAQMDARAWPALKQELAALFKTKSRDQWCELLEGTDACFAPVLDYQEAAQHPHMQARDAYIELDGKMQPAPAPKFSRTVSEVSGSVDKIQDLEKLLGDWN